MKKLQRISLPIIFLLTLTTNVYAFDIKNYIQQTNPNLDQNTIDQYAIAIQTYSDMYNLDPAVVTAIAYKESRFIPDIKSKGNYGSMQINWTSHKKRLKNQGVSREDLLTIESNIKAGCELLRILLDRNGQNLHVALQRYNTVAPNSYANSIISKARKLNPELKVSIKKYKKTKKYKKQQPTETEEVVVESTPVYYQQYYNYDGSYYVIQD